MSLVSCVKPRIHVVTRSGKLYEGDLYKMSQRENLIFLKNVTFKPISPPTGEEETNMAPIPFVSIDTEDIMELRDFRPWYARDINNDRAALASTYPGFIFDPSTDVAVKLTCDVHLKDAVLVAILDNEDKQMNTKKKASSAAGVTTVSSQTSNAPNNGSSNQVRRRRRRGPCKCLCCARRPRCVSAPSNLADMSICYHNPVNDNISRCLLRNAISQICRQDSYFDVPANVDNEAELESEIDTEYENESDLDIEGESEEEDLEVESEEEIESGSEEETADEEEETDDASEIDSESDSASENESTSTISNDEYNSNQEVVKAESVAAVKADKEKEEDDDDDDDEGAVGGATAPLVNGTPSSAITLQNGKDFYDPKKSFFDTISTRTRKHPSRLPTWRSFEINTETFGPNSMPPDDFNYYVVPEIRYTSNYRYQRNPRFRGAGRYSYVSRANPCYSTSLAFKNWRLSRGHDTGPYSNFYKRPIMGGEQRFVGDTSHIFSLRDHESQQTFNQLPVPPQGNMGQNYPKSESIVNGPKEAKPPNSNGGDVRQNIPLKELEQIVKDLNQVHLPKVYQEILRAAPGSSAMNSNRTPQQLPPQQLPPQQFPPQQLLPQQLLPQQLPPQQLPPQQLPPQMTPQQPPSMAITENATGREFNYINNVWRFSSNTRKQGMF